MNLDELIKKHEELLIITPTSTKMRLLRQYQNLMQVKFMTLDEYKNHFFFSYDYQTIDYMMEKYQYHLDVCKVLLSNLYVIDIHKDYHHVKLEKLKGIKQDLIQQGLLSYDPLFRKYIQGKTVIVYGYPNLEKYEEEMFQNHIMINNKGCPFQPSVVKCKTIEEEVLYVVEEIVHLIKQGISMNKIYLTNVGDEYLYTLNRIFHYFHLPINLDLKESIYGTNFVKEYLQSKKLPSFRNRVSKKLIQILNRLSFLSDCKNYEYFLLDELKNAYLSPIHYQEAVNILNLYEEVDEDSYLFVLGFNQDMIPKTYKDEEYITDNLKDEVALDQTIEKNKKEKKAIINYLSQINHLFISYKEKSNFNSYLPSSLISDLDLEVIEYDANKIFSSHSYNQLVLAECLEKYYKYGEIKPNLSLLYSNYSIPYRTYSNDFTGIDSKYLDFIHHQIKLSYTSLNEYNYCAFKYYIDRVLKINPFCDTFSIFIGNLYHHLFSLMYQEDFDFEREWDKYLSMKQLSLKEKLWLKPLKANLLEVIDIMKKQQLLSKFKEVFCEKEVNIFLDQEMEVLFTGKIDKINYYRHCDDTYFSLVDYKTGNINTNIYHMKYGLDMQLPIYLYLLIKSHLFENPIFSGIYFQRVLFPRYSFEKGKNLTDIKYNDLKLRGYSTDDLERLSLFDSSYENSDMIKSLKINKDGSFSKMSKLLSDTDIFHVVSYTDKVIKDTANHIIHHEFSINPKVVDNQTPCINCQFHDICFVHPSNYEYLESVNNLDFLESDIYGMDN